jgi:CHAD domain-containing protein
LGIAALVPVDTHAIDRALRFAVGRDYQLPDLRPLVGQTVRLAEQHLRTAYYDTEDRRLWNRGITLRYRTEGDQRSGKWSLELPQPAGGTFLSRARLGWAGGRETVPPQAVSILRGVVRRAPLFEVAELETSRRRLALHGRRRDRAWGEIDDDFVMVVGGPKDGLGFRQVELELAPDHPRAADLVVASLREPGAQMSDLPKLAIALDDTHGRKAVSGSSVRRRETLAVRVQMTIGEAFDRLLDHDYRVRVDPERAEAHDVHQARVAIRRLRSALKTFGPALDPVWRRHTGAELRWIGEILGRVRDADVLLAGLSDAGDGMVALEPGGRELVVRVQEERRRAVLDLSDALDDERYLDLLDRLHAAANAVPVLRGAAAGDQAFDPDAGAASSLSALVQDRWRSLERRVRKAGTDPTARELHRIRIAAKQLRYAAEVAAPVIGKAARRTAGAAERVQTVLGEFHDAAGAERWLRQVLDDPHVTPPAGFAAGVLTREKQIRQRHLRRRWRSEWRKLHRPKHHS